MIVVGVFDQAWHEAESLQNCFLEEEQSLRVRVLSKLCAHMLIVIASASANYPSGHTFEEVAFVRH